MNPITPGIHQTILDIAAEIKNADPSINGITGKMVKDYINISRDKSDDRLDVMFTHTYYINVVLAENGYMEDIGEKPKPNRKYYY